MLACSILKMALGCNHQKVKIHHMKHYSNNSDHFPRQIIIIARGIQQIAICYDIFSSHKHFKVSQVFTSAFSVVFRKMALGCVPAAVPHTGPPYHTPVWYGASYQTALISPALTLNYWRRITLRYNKILISLVSV